MGIEFGVLDEAMEVIGKQARLTAKEGAMEELEGIQISSLGRHVVVCFGGTVSWLGMDVAEARRMGQRLLDASEVALSNFVLEQEGARSE